MDQDQRPPDIEHDEPYEGPTTLAELVEYLAKGVVESPDQIEVKTVEGPSALIIELKVAPEDMGKVIGKDGRVVRSIRTLLKIASTREQRRALLEIV